MDFVALHLLKAHPDVGLYVLDQVAQVDGTVGIGQGGSDEDAAHFGGVQRGKREL
jgi:hypothetical protein